MGDRVGAGVHEPRVRPGYVNHRRRHLDGGEPLHRLHDQRVPAHQRRRVGQGRAGVGTTRPESSSGRPSTGTGTALSTSVFTTQVTHTATSPSKAAYALGLFHNSNTTGGAITVYLDEAQIEEATAA